jgi:hypothetical protein
MVLHRPIEFTRVIGHVDLCGFHLSGFGVYQDLPMRFETLGQR